MPSGPGSEKYWKEATAIAEKAGYRHFGDGSVGAAFRSRMAEKLAARDKKPTKK